MRSGPGCHCIQGGRGACQGGSPRTQEGGSGGRQSSRTATGAEALVQPCATRASFQKSQHVAVWQTHGKQQVRTGLQKPPRAKLPENLGPSRGTLKGFWAEEGSDQNSVLGSVTIIFFFF